VNDITRVVREAFHVATTGRPGPVLIDLPKDVQMTNCTPQWDVPMNLPGYDGRRKEPTSGAIEQVAAAIKMAKRPVIYCGGGIIAADASEELREFVRITGIPVVMTIMGLGAFPTDDPLSLDMLGMHGSVYANRAVRDCDLLLAFGVRFDDRVTGKLSEFAKHARIVHIDIDPSELNKIKPAHLPIVADMQPALRALNKLVVSMRQEIAGWVEQCQQWKREFPFQYNQQFDGILQQHAIATLCEKTRERKTIIASGVGQHQMWVAQFYKFRYPRTWLSSSGLGTMGFGLPAAMGAQVAHPDALVVDIDGDGSFQMNIQELATCYCENLPVKVLLLNNQHLGMVVQWEDRFMAGNRAHTYLGPIHHAEASGNGRGVYAAERYPDYVTIAKGYGCGAATVSRKSDLSDAMDDMLSATGPFVLDVQVPYMEHVLPMIPTGHSVDDTIMQ